jgi:hypothetical protein
MLGNIFNKTVVWFRHADDGVSRDAVVMEWGYEARSPFEEKALMYQASIQRHT